MQATPSRTYWQQHPLALATGVLLIVCALMVTQKFVRFGSAPNYDLINSLAYNLITIVPFCVCVAAGLMVRHTTAGWSWQVRALTIVAAGIGLLAVYAVTISAVLFVLGMSSSWPSEAFLTKYISGPLHVHAALFALVQFVPVPERSRAQPDAISRPPDLFGIPSDKITAIEADDHYVWLHSTDGSVLERITMRDLSNRLPDNFARVHRSHIVNLDHVAGLRRRGRNIYLSVGKDWIPVSASRRARVLARLPSSVRPH